MLSDKEDYLQVLFSLMQRTLCKIWKHPTINLYNVSRSLQRNNNIDLYSSLVTILEYPLKRDPSSDFEIYQWSV